MLATQESGHFQRPFHSPGNSKYDHRLLINTELQNQKEKIKTKANQKKLELGKSKPPVARPQSLVMQKMDQDFKKEAKRSRSHDGKFQVGK